MRPTLHYATDANCCWCHAFSPVMAAIEQRYADRIEIRVHGGGMLPQPTPIGRFFERIADPLGLHQHITRVSGQAFGEPYLDLVRRRAESGRQLYSLMPTMALIALRQLQPGQGLRHAAEIQNLHCLEGLDLNEPATYANLATRLSLDPAALLEGMMASGTPQHARSEFRHVSETLGVRGFPAAILIDPAGHRYDIASGYAREADVAARIDAALARIALSADTSDTARSCALDGRCS